MKNILKHVEANSYLCECLWHRAIMPLGYKDGFIVGLAAKCQNPNCGNGPDLFGDPVETLPMVNKEDHEYWAQMAGKVAPEYAEIIRNLDKESSLIVNLDSAEG